MKKKIFVLCMIVGLQTVIAGDLVSPAPGSKTHIENLYKDISGFGISKSECDLITNKGGAPTYGEITYDSVEMLLDDLKLTKNDVFYDLGSGVGKMVVQVYFNTPVKKSVGVELAPTRTKYAQEVKEQLDKDGLVDKKRKLEFHQKDILELSYTDATVVYCASTCYTEEFMQKMADVLAKGKKGLRVATLKKLPEHKKFELIKI